MTRRHYALLGLVAALGLVAGTSAIGTTLAAFSDTTNNTGNTFSAAASFCAAPGAQSVIADADSYVDQNSAGSNYGAAPALHVQSRSGGGRNRRALVHFPLPAAQFCAVTSATLRLYVTSAAPGRTLDVYGIAGAWTEAGVTWANQPPTAGAPSSTISASGWLEWDVTAQVQAMYAGSNDGFLVRDSVETQNPASLQVMTSREGVVQQPELVVILA